MSSNLITKQRSVWTGIILILLLGFLFLPGVKNTLLHKAPANTADGTMQAGKNVAGIAPSSANQPGAGLAESASPQGAIDPSSRYVLFHVIDAKDGRGIAGAMLHAGEQLDPELEPPASPWVTDSKGDCSVIVLPRSFVTVIAAGYLNHTVRFPSSEYIHAEYVFKLEKGVAVGGTVHNEAGQPIRDVRVLIRPRYKEVLPAKIPTLESLMSAVVTTDASGRWHAQNVPLDSDAMVSFELTHPEYLQARYWTEQSFQSLDGELVNSVSMRTLRRQEAVFTLKEGFAVFGAVLGENGKSIQGATISQRDSLSGITLRLIPKGTTSPDGRFSFIASKPEEIVVVAQAPGYAPANQRIRIASKMPPIQFRLAKGNVLTGRIVDDDYKPVPGASISTVTNAQFNREYFPWQGKSDIDGTFLWDSAPAFPMAFSVTAEGYQNPNVNAPYFLLEPGKENEVRLQKVSGIRVTAKVFDQKTSQPIDNFKVTTLRTFQIPGQTGPRTSPGGPVVQGTNGEFTLNLLDRSNSVAKMSYSIRVEAQGYIPNNSQVVDPANGDQTLIFAMVRGDGIQGIVKLPDGHPVIGAKVSLFGIPGRQPTMLNSSALSYSGSFCETVTTDQEGRFSLNVMPEAHSIAAIHEKGVVTAIPPKPGTFSTLVLQLWGRIEGKVKVGNRDGANQRVMIGALITIPSPPGIMVALSSTTDSQGRFAIEKVPAMEYRVSSTNGSTTALVRPGQTVSVTLGGKGCPVIGRFVIADPESQITLSRLRASLSSILPDIALPGRTDAAAYQAWAESEEGRQRLRAEVSYSVQVSADGSFRVEDVAAGKYLLYVRARDIDPTRRDLGPEADFKREVVVPQMPGDRSDEPLNLGAIALSVPRKK